MEYYTPQLNIVLFPYLGDAIHHVSGHLTQSDNVQELTSCVNGEISKLKLVNSTDGQLKLFHRDQGTMVFKQKLPKFLSQQLGGGSLGNAVAPMPGVIEKVYVQDGDTVKAGEKILFENFPWNRFLTSFSDMYMNTT